MKMKDQHDAAADAAAEAITSLEAPALPWWAKLTRWRQTSREEAVHSEQGVLSRLRSAWRVEDVAVAEQPEHFLHTTSGGDPQGTPLVLMPGYGAGTGFFFRNLDGLARAFRVFAVDWLGTGLSGRPAYTATDLASAEAFFLDSLEAWRAKQGLESMILVGHSLGGYLAATYALKHPEAVRHLVLVCPAGIPAKPEGWESRYMTDTMSLRTQLIKLAAKAWMAGYTPGSVIRALGPWGPGLVEKYVTGRFSMHGQPLEPGERDAFTGYFYHLAAQRGSGEYALRHILAPGAWAHAPLHDRLTELKVPVTLIYGASDWMNPEAGRAAMARLDALRPRKVASDHAVEVIDDAGHFCFLEQPHAFNAALLRTMAPHLPRGLAERLQRQEEADRQAQLARLEQPQQQQQGAGQPQQKDGGGGEPRLAKGGGQ